MLDWLGHWALDIFMRLIAISLAGFSMMRARKGGSMSWMWSLLALPLAVFIWRVLVGANLFSTIVFALFSLMMVRVAYGEAQAERVKKETPAPRAPPPPTASH